MTTTVVTAVVELDSHHRTDAAAAHDHHMHAPTVAVPSFGSEQA